VDGHVEDAVDVGDMPCQSDCVTDADVEDQAAEAHELGEADGFGKAILTMN
jgi:hypothetical protein